MSPFVESAAAAATTPLRPVLLAVTVDLDRSVFIQMALFAVLVVVLKPLLFDPMLRVFALREQRTDGAKAEARSMQERAADILIKYEGEVASARAQANQERDASRKETARLEAEILEEARRAADAITTAGRKAIGIEVSQLERELETQSGAFAQAIGSQVLGREIRS